MNCQVEYSFHVCSYIVLTWCFCINLYFISQKNTKLLLIPAIYWSIESEWVRLPESQSVVQEGENGGWNLSENLRGRQTSFLGSESFSYLLIFELLVFDIWEEIPSEWCNLLMICHLSEVENGKLLRDIPTLAERGVQANPCLWTITTSVSKYKLTFF